MVIRNISLGDYSAENDSQLSDYFLSETESYRSAEDMSDHRYILLGRTGSGKSATLSYLSEKFESNQKYMCTFIRPGKSYLDAVVQMDEFHELKHTQGLQHILYKLIWQYVIMVAVLQNKYGSHGPKKKGRLLSGEKLKAYKFLRKAEQLATEDKTLFDIISGLLKEISVSLKGITVKGEARSSSSYEVMRDLIRETEEFHKNGFWEVVGGAKLYILFDDLDLGWNPDDEGQQLLLRGLFEIMRDYAYRDRVKPLIALRTNILEGLKLRQREKYDNNILTIRWTKPNLKKMLLLRLRKYGGLEETDGFEKMFHTDPDPDKDTIDYMIGRTLYRPRDLLAFCQYSISEASKAGAETIGMEHVLAAEATYSVNRLQALSDEWKFLYPNLNALVTLMMKISLKRKFDLFILKTTELKEVLIETKERILTAQDNETYLSDLLWIRSYFPSDDDPSEIVQILYKLGVVGFRTGVGRGSLNFVNELDRMSNIDKETKFAFHPMLHNLPMGLVPFKEDSPWS
jgi:hypothetical protein